jgi:hypothetical protein
MRTPEPPVCSYSLPLSLCLPSHSTLHFSLVITCFLLRNCSLNVPLFFLSCLLEYSTQEGFFKLPPNFRNYAKFISYGWG